MLMISSDHPGLARCTRSEKRGLLDKRGTHRHAQNYDVPEHLRIPLYDLSFVCSLMVIFRLNDSDLTRTFSLWVLPCTDDLLVSLRVHMLALLISTDNFFIVKVSLHMHYNTPPMRPSPRPVKPRINRVYNARKPMRMQM
jgi:hypothetical protein